MGIEQRTEYRVELDESSDLAVSIENPPGSTCSGRLLDVSGSGAGARFPVPDCPILAVGQEVPLVFTCGRLKAPVTVQAMVQHRAEERGFRRYGFRFLERELDPQLPAELRKLFNRRRVLRVAPDSESPVAVVLEGGGGGPRVKTRLADLSPLGVGVSLEAEAESTLAHANRIGISLSSLPGCGIPLHLIGSIRYRQLIGADIRYGIEFDPELSENFARQEGQITRYVMERQRELLRAAARKRG